MPSPRSLTKTGGIIALAFAILCESGHLPEWMGLTRPWWTPSGHPGEAIRNASMAGGYFLMAAAYLAWIWLVGRMVNRWCHGAGQRPGAPALELGAGFLAVILLVGALGSVGLLHPACLAAAGLAVVMASRSRRPRRIVVPEIRWSDAGPALCLLPALPWLIMAPLAPPVDADVLVYHLALPELWRLTHRIVAEPGKLVMFFPLGAEQVSLPLTWLGSFRTIAAFQILLLGATAWLYARVLASHLGDEARMAGWLLIAGAATLRLAADGHPDVSMLLATVVFLAALEDRRGPAWGIGMGLAVLCKLTGGVLVLSWVAASVLTTRPSVRGWRIAAVIAFLTIGGWPLRNWLMTGNPAYPLGFPEIPSLHWSPRSDAMLELNHRQVHPFGGWSDWAPVRTMIAREWHALAREGFPALLGFVLLLPTAFLLSPKGSRSRPLSLQAGLFSLMLVHPASMIGRYAIPLLISVIPCALLLIRSAPRFLWRGVLATVLLMESVHFGVVYQATHPQVQNILFGVTGPARGLESAAPGYRFAVDWINRQPRGRGRVALLGNAGGYGLTRAWRGDDNADQAFPMAVAEGTTDPQRMRIRVRASGVRWIMFDPDLTFYGSTAPYVEVPPRAWYQGWSEFWMANMRPVLPAGRPAGPSEWCVFEYHPLPIPRSDRISSSVSGRRAWEKRLFGDHAAYWLAQALIARVVDHDDPRTVFAGERAFRLGCRKAWLMNTLSAIAYRQSNYRRAAEWASMCLTVWPRDTVAPLNLAAARARLPVKTPR